MNKIAKERLGNSKTTVKEIETKQNVENVDTNNDPLSGGNMFTNLVLSTGVGQNLKTKSILSHDVEPITKEEKELIHEDSRPVVRNTFSDYNALNRVKLLNTLDYSIR